MNTKAEISRARWVYSCIITTSLSYSVLLDNLWSLEERTKCFSYFLMPLIRANRLAKNLRHPFCNFFSWNKIFLFMRNFVLPWPYYLKLVQRYDYLRASILQTLDIYKSLGRVCDKTIHSTLIPAYLFFVIVWLYTLENGDWYTWGKIGK